MLPLPGRPGPQNNVRPACQQSRCHCNVEGAMRPDANPVPLLDPVRKFVLFTNGKCGGTTIKTWFF
jgi:hypothetical protein